MKSADKGMGLSAIIARHGIKPEETTAFGDGGNDISRHKPLFFIARTCAYHG